MENKENASPAQTEGDRISMLQSDMLALIDIVTAASRKVELIDRDALFAAFADKVRYAQPEKAEDLKKDADAKFEEVVHNPGSEKAIKFRSKQEMKAHADQVPTIQDQREAFSRREIITAILTGQSGAALAAAEAAEAAQPKGEARDITPAYFDEVLGQVLGGDYGVARFTSWDGKEYFHFRPLLSGSYARMLSTKNNPIEAIVDLVRENARIYPAITPVQLFYGEPFNMKPEDLDTFLEQIAKDEEKKDIRYTRDSLGGLYLYSDRWIEDDYAEALAESIISASMNP